MLLVIIERFSRFFFVSSLCLYRRYNNLYMLIWASMYVALYACTFCKNDEDDHDDNIHTNTQFNIKNKLYFARGQFLSILFFFFLFFYSSFFFILNFMFNMYEYAFVVAVVLRLMSFLDSIQEKKTEKKKHLQFMVVSYTVHCVH